MAGYSNAGRVLLLPKGDYTAETTYTTMDYVRYKGSTYVCKADVTATAATNPSSDTTHWQQLAEGMDITAFTALQTKVNDLQDSFDNLFEVVHTW